VLPGQVIAITVPDGRQIQLTLPERAVSGDQLELWLDPQAGTLEPVSPAEPRGDCSEQVMSIEIPAGVQPNQVIAITVPDGRQIELTVPAGKQGGDHLDLWFDPVAGTLAPLA
jgi:hypothetical protein